MRICKNFLDKIHDFLYLGGQDGNSDYMAVESVAGKVVFHFRISDGYGRIKTNETIFDSEEWRQISVSR